MAEDFNGRERAWFSVYNFCKENGMNTENNSSGLENVIDFISSLKEKNKKKTWQIYLSMDTKFSSPYVKIRAKDCHQLGDEMVYADGIEIDFHNEILGISEV